MARMPEGCDPRSNRPDWRGWIGLVWVLVWGWAYALMVIQARAPQVLAWFRYVTGSH
jgi:hypothetical protein